MHQIAGLYVAAALVLHTGVAQAAQDRPPGRRVAAASRLEIGAAERQVRGAPASHGADDAALLERRAALVVRDTTLAAALTLLERHSGVPLAYSPSLLRSGMAVTCDCAGATVAEALTQLLASTALTFHASGNQVVIAPASSSGRSAPDLRGTASRSSSGAALAGLSPVPPQGSGLAPDRRIVSMRQATITGRVTTEGGAPVGQALVSIPSLALSATTNDAGAFRIVVPTSRLVPRTDTLRVTRLGYRPAIVPFALRAGEIQVNAVLTTQATMLDEIVVTGTAGDQQRRTQPAVVSTIDAADIISKAPVLNTNELLTARSPGVSLTTGSGAAGANTRINIRGQASVSLSNYPLVFVDGVRITAGPRAVAQVPGGGTAGTGGQQFSALNDLNPADIESIEIVKGPAAATLYGADASAGVIQIITKRGRAGTAQITHSLSYSHDIIEPNFTPVAAYGRCTAALIAPTSVNPLCRGQAVGAVVSDNVLVRNNVFHNGAASVLQYSVRGGGENFGYFASFSADDTKGTVLGNSLNHRTGRVNVNWTATPRLALDFGLGLVRAQDRLPQGDQSTYSYNVGGMLASPLSVRQGADGELTGGWFMPATTVESISSILTQNTTIRTTPSARLQYRPFAWFSNRITAGADLGRVAARQMYPKNANNWYSGTLNTGVVAQNETFFSLYTLDYLGTVSHRLGTENRISSELSFGSQWINATNELLTGSGIGLVTNTANTLSWATTTTGGQGFDQSKSFGVFVQEQLGFRDRLFLQLGARMDRNSAFGSDVDALFLPKAGVSWVLSEEPFWATRVPWFSTLRLRAAYGTTGRSPGGVAALQTYTQTNFATDAGVVLPGVSPGSPGNPNLRPERGVETEAGFDAGFFQDRLSIELTYFNKVSKDLLLPLPIAPSAGFTSSPLVNIGEVSNRGFEIGVRATPIDRGAVTWATNLNVATLRNRIESMGDITPFVSASNQCFKPGIPVAAWCVPRVISVDTARNLTLVSDTAEFVGSQLPKLEGNLSSTLTLFRAVRLYALVDGKFGHKIYNLTRDFRDRALANTAERVLTAEEGGYSEEERLRRFGPFRRITNESAVGAALVRDPYITPGDFVRFRELTATWSIPAAVFRSVGLTSSSISIGAKNLALWTKYDGFDPEVFGVPDPVTPYLADVFTTPPSRRIFTRFSVQF